MPKHIDAAHRRRRLVFDGEEGALQFVWDQRWCDVFRNDGKKPIFIKDIRRVYSREYGAPDSVVLVDDDAYKACRNPPHTAIHPPRFEAGRADDALADGGAIRAYLERLAHAPSVPAFIAAHPFPNAALSSARPRGVGESDRCGLTERG